MVTLYFITPTRFNIFTRFYRKKMKWPSPPREALNRMNPYSRVRLDSNSAPTDDSPSDPSITPDHQN